jgi:hypothetical protein
LFASVARGHNAWFETTLFEHNVAFRQVPDQISKPEYTIYEVNPAGDFLLTKLEQEQ